jgi:F-actin capping protein, beta subunit
MDLSGNMVRQLEQDLPVDDDAGHVANIGRMVEDMELKMRNLLQEVYFGKAKDVVGDLRSTRNTLREMMLTITRHSSTQRDEQRQSSAPEADQRHRKIADITVEAACFNASHDIHYL